MWMSRSTTTRKIVTMKRNENVSLDALIDRTIERFDQKHWSYNQWYADAMRSEGVMGLIIQTYDEFGDCKRLGGTIMRH